MTSRASSPLAVPLGYGRPRTRLWLGMLVLVAPIAFAQAPPAAVLTDAVRAEELQEQRLVTGEIRARSVSRVAAVEPGRLVALEVLEGAPVAAGQVLARLDDSRLQLEVKLLDADRSVAESVLQERRLRHEQAVRDAKQLRELASRNATNPKEVADAESEERVAASRILQAEEQISQIGARLALLQKRLNDMVIRAPFAGSITRRLREVGEWVAQGESIVELTSTSALEGWLAVPQQFLAPVVASSDPITVRVVASGEELVGRERRVIPSIDAEARNFPLVVTLSDTGDRVAPGMSITSYVPVGASSTQLTVARDAILRGDVGPYVYVVRSAAKGGPSQAFPVPVRVSFSLQDRVVVTAAGLQGGDEVVVEGNERLYPTAAVLPTPRPPTASKKRRNPRDSGKQGRAAASRPRGSDDDSTAPAPSGSEPGSDRSAAPESRPGKAAASSGGNQ